MSVSERHVGTVTIIDVTGELTQGAAGDTLLDKVASLLQQGPKDVLINLGDVTSMDSTGLGTLVAAFTTASRRGGSLKLLNLTKRLHDQLVVTKLSKMFECFDDEALAVSSFGTPA